MSTHGVQGQRAQVARVPTVLWHTPGFSLMERHVLLSGAASPPGAAQDDDCAIALDICFWPLNFRTDLCSFTRRTGPWHGNPNVQVTLSLPGSRSANTGEPRVPGIIPNTLGGLSRSTSRKPQRQVRICKCADKPERSGGLPAPGHRSVM